MSRTWLPRAVGALLLAGMVFLAGCSDKRAQQVGELNKSNVQRIANLYAAYQNMKSSSGPKNQEELTKFIQEYDPEKLKLMGVDKNNISSLFTSERDGQPIEVRWGVGGGRGSVAAVAAEKSGKDGQFQVGFTGGEVKEVDKSARDSFMKGEGATPPASSGGPPSGGRPGGSGRPPGAPTGPGK